MAALIVRRWRLAVLSVFILLVLLVMAWPRASVSSVAIKPRAMQLMPSDIHTVRFVSLEVQQPFSGTLSPVRQMLLNARVAGEVTEVAAREGEAVAVGGLLLRQDSREIGARLAQAEAAVQSSRAELETAREQVRKFRQLTLKNFFSRNDLEKAETQVAVHESQLKANEAAVVMARKSLEDATLRAPFSGMVAERLVEPGQMVMPNTPLLRIVDLRELELAIQLPSSEISRIRKGQQISFRVDAFGSELFPATIVRLNPLAKASNRKITVYATVANPDLRLRGGLFVSGTLADASAPAGLAIPVTALQTQDGQDGVMVVRQQHLAWQPVTLGARDERSGRVLVETGLQEGDTVLATRVSPRRAGATVSFASGPAPIAEAAGG